MRILKYLIFLLFNISYKDGRLRKNSTPYADATFVVMFYELLIVAVGIFFLDRYLLDLSSVADILKPLGVS